MKTPEDSLHPDTSFPPNEQSLYPQNGGISLCSSWEHPTATGVLPLPSPASFNKQLLSTYGVPGPVLDIGDRAVNRIDKTPLPPGVTV